MTKGITSLLKEDIIRIYLEDTLWMKKKTSDKKKQRKEQIKKENQKKNKKR